MSAPLYFSAKSIGNSRRGERKPQTLLVAARHNLRELQAETGAHEGIALELSHLNVVLYGASTAKEVYASAAELKSRYAVPKRKLRKDHVQALEFVISVRDDSDFEPMDYFRASLRWLIQVFGAEMLLSAVVHFDEGAPHMHALVLPIVDAEYCGGRPIDKPNLPKLTKRFADEVGKHFGLSFEPKKKLGFAQRKAAFNLVLDRLNQQLDPVISSQIWQAVCDNIKQQPDRFVELLGLELPEMPSKKQKTSTQIFTGTGRKTTEDRARRATHDLSCVGQRNSAKPFSGARS